MRCLVIQTAFLGDVILTVPLLLALRALDGIEHVSALVSPAGADILGTQNLLDEMVVYDKRGSGSGPGGLAGVVGSVRRIEADTAVIPHRSFRSALIARSARIPRRVGFDVSGGRCFLTDVVPYRAGIHEAERCASLVVPLGGALPDDRLPFSLTVPASDSEAAAEILSASGVGADDATAVVAPGSRWATKRWFPERFAAVADELARTEGLKTVVVGSAGDQGAAAAVRAAAREPLVDATGSLSIGEWLAVIKRSALVVSNDSAAAHAAAGLATPVVSVFGPTVASQGFAPYSDSSRVVSAPVACRPCGRHGSERCVRGTLECLDAVAVDDVLAAARELLVTE